jgi:hypothetical protein
MDEIYRPADFRWYRAVSIEVAPAAVCAARLLAALSYDLPRLEQVAVSRDSELAGSHKASFAILL